MQKDGTIIVHKLGGRNLYSKKEISSLLKSKVQRVSSAELNV